MDYVCGYEMREGADEDLFDAQEDEEIDDVDENMVDLRAELSEVKEKLVHELHDLIRLDCR